MEMSPRICAEDKRNTGAGRLRLTGALALVLMLAGCAAVEPEPEPDTGSEAKQQEKDAIPPETRQAFRAAVKDLDAGRYQQASQRLEPLADNDPPLPGALPNLGIAYRHLERYPQAERLLRRAVELRPEWVNAHVELGIVLRHQGRFEPAREAYEQALAVDDANPTAHLNLGVLCDLYLRDLGCARTHYERYQELAAEEDQQVSLWIADLERRMETQ
jgi:Flp pilus assembly protein TadD